MTVEYVEVGFVSSDPQLVDFLREVFLLEHLGTYTGDFGATVKLKGAGGTILKVHMPSERPEPAPAVEPFDGCEGIRYLTLRVRDLAGVLERAVARGGTVVSVRESPNLRGAIIRDPRGNTYELSQSPA